MVRSKYSRGERGKKDIRQTREEESTRDTHISVLLV